jgi:hypothetical protein
MMLRATFNAFAQEATSYVVLGCKSAQLASNP